jgi:HemY protein
MKRLILLYVFFVLAIYVGLHIQKDPGYVLVSLGHWTIETPLWVALTCLLLGFFIIYFFLGTIKRVNSISGVWQRFRQRLARKRSHNLTKAGLIAYSEGKWQEAEAELLKALPGSKTPLINYLVSARAAEAQGDSTSRDKYLRNAAEIIPEADMAVGITQTELQLAAHQYEQALATLTHLHELSPKHPYVLTLLLKLYLELNDWKALEKVLPQIKRYSQLEEKELTKVELKVYMGLISLACDASLEQLKDAYYALPRYLKNHADIVHLYSTCLIKKNDLSEAEGLLRQAIKKSWSDILIRLYGSIKIDKPNKQLHFLENQLPSHADNPALLLALGQLTYSMQLWGKSRNYLEKSVALAENPETRFELGKLLQTLDEHQEAEGHFKQGLATLLTKSKDAIN